MDLKNLLNQALNSDLVKQGSTSIKQGASALAIWQKIKITSLHLVLVPSVVD